MCSGSRAPGSYGLQGISAAVAEFVTRSDSRLFGQHWAWGTCCGDDAGGGAGVSWCVLVRAEACAVPERGVSVCGGWRRAGCVWRFLLCAACEIHGGVGLSGAGARLVYIVDAPCRSVGVPPCGEWRRRSCAQRLERMGVRMSRAVWMGLGALGMSTLPPDGRLRASAAKVRAGRGRLPAARVGEFPQREGCVRHRQIRRLFRLFAAYGAIGRAVCRYGCERDRLRVLEFFAIFMLLNIPSYDREEAEKSGCGCARPAVVPSCRGPEAGGIDE